MFNYLPHKIETKKHKYQLWLNERFLDRQTQAAIFNPSADDTLNDSEELRVNVLYAGHYATETFGVRALAGHLVRKYRIDQTFKIGRASCRERV